MDALLQDQTRDQAELLSSLLLFTRYFYEVRTGRRFELSQPAGRESHFITICRALTRVFNGECRRLIINVPPRYGKSELLIHFVAWALAQYPDSNFIYTSYSHSLAKRQTQTIRSIIQMSDYRQMFNVSLQDDTTAKDDFTTKQGGSIYAAGSAGSITGRGAGIKAVDRFGGAIIIDDAIKPHDATSDVIRESVNDWYYDTLVSRLNSPQTPIIFIGQRVHEDDLAGHLLRSGEWETVILPALDEAGNALYPEMNNVESLLKMQTENPYVFASQQQQDPQPAGGGIFKPDWFVVTDEEPEILATFITADTAETSKSYNDATVFSFWGVYKIFNGNIDSGLLGLHWIDCLEVRVEPKDLRETFYDFYAQCMTHSIKPMKAFIEKKSTGVTLVSVLNEMQGLQVVGIDKNAASGSKVERFLQMQPYVASKRISIPAYAKHTQICINHMIKITTNNSHRHDDIADTAADAVKVALIDNVILPLNSTTLKQDQILDKLSNVINYRKSLRNRRYG